MIYYNCHTHIFNLECIPERFISAPVSRLMSKNRISLGLVRLLDNFFGSEKDFLSKQATFLKYNTEDWQELIFERLKKVYPPGTKFVVLTLDMDFMGAGKAQRNFLTQLAEIKSIRRIHPETLLPFLSVDPRRNPPEGLLGFVKDHYENHGFFGIKLYPPLGFFPFDPRLFPVYEYAEKNNIPIITHCNKAGGVYFKGGVLKEWDYGKRDFHNHDHKGKMNLFRDNLMHPENYVEVLNRFPGLKICFAHYGGDVEVLSRENNSWRRIIKDLILKTGQNGPTYPNLYTDISFALWNTKLFPVLKEDCQAPVMEDRILFGTDFYMTSRKKNEEELRNEFPIFIGPEIFKKTARNNIKTFLSSARYPFNNP